MNLNDDKLTAFAEEIILDNNCFIGHIDAVKEFLAPFISKAIILSESFKDEPKDVERILSTLSDDLPFRIYNSLLEKILSEVHEFLELQKAGKLTRPMDSEELDSLWDFYKHGFAKGIELNNLRLFSEHLRIAKNELTIFTGYPASGKSEFVDELMVGLALQEKWKCAVFSPENYPHAVHYEKLLSKKIGKPFHEPFSDNQYPRMTQDEVSKGMNWINEHFTMLSPHEDNISLDSILGLAKKAIIEHKIDLLLIDPWNELSHNKPRDLSETDYIGESLMRCRRFARNNNICFWIVAHPQKPLAPKDGGELPVPGPYNISGSQHWANKSDNCLTIYRPRAGGVEVHIQKVKFKMRGHIGTVKFDYDKVTGRYTEINSPSQGF